MLPRKIFEILYTVVAILALFQPFLRKFCLNFLLLTKSECFTKCDAFYLTADSVHYFDFSRLISAVC